MTSLRKKEKQMKKVICENEKLKTKFEHFLINYRDVHEKLEIICCKYLDMLTKKEEEVIFFNFDKKINI